MSIAVAISRGFTFLWGGWGLFWLLAARWSAPTEQRQTAVARVVHLAFVLTGSALLFVMPSTAGFLGRTLPGAGTATAVAGLSLTLIGLAFASWARVTMGRMWSAQVTLKAGHVIIDRGPYALARHPIYTGILLAFLGTAAARGTVAGFLGFAIVSIGLVVKLRQEEKLLLGHFGAAYEGYRGRVKGLVPLVW
jgi:protein-S-isoprenylcysteine O-methyltransferase Ste14